MFKDTIRKYAVPLACALVAVVFFLMAISSGNFSKDPNKVARASEYSLGRKLAAVDKLCEKALQPDTTDWMNLGKVEEDVVIYKYMYDTLQSWCNEFVIANDALQAPIFTYQRVSRPEYGLVSPIAQLGSEWSFENIGPKWYVAKVVKDGSCSVVAALEICSVDADGQFININNALKIPESYSIRPLTGYIGTEVKADGKPIFLIANTSPDTTRLFANSRLRWIGLVLLVIALLLYLPRRKTLLSYCVVSISFLVFYYLARYWGGQMTGSTMVFSPTLYASGQVWSSFGALMLLNLLVLCEYYAFFLSREAIFGLVKEKKAGYVALIALSLTLFVGGLVYTIVSAGNLINNSSITYEIQWFKNGLGFTLIALVVYGFLFSSHLLLLRVAAEAMEKINGTKIRILTPLNLCIASLVTTSILFGMSAQLGFKKEQSRVYVWANRLAVDRDLGLELHLRSVEEAIMSDEVIAMLSSIDGMNNLIVKRLEESYMMRYANDYDIQVSTCAISDMDCMLLFAKKLQGGTPIADITNFVCQYSNSGRASYVGLFNYSREDGVVTRMLVEINSRAAREDSGYYSVFKDWNSPGSVVIPEEYSYGKYVASKLVSYKGTFAYPTVLVEEYTKYVNEGRKRFNTKGYTHFINSVGEDEVIVISRAKRTILQLLSSFLSMLTVVLVCTLPLLANRRKRKVETKNTFRRRISLVLTAAIFIALVTLASISIKFVFDRNRSDVNDMMSSRISTIQTMVESLVPDVQDPTAIMTQEFRNEILAVASNTRSDVNLYTPTGRLFVTTVPDVFDQNILSPRISNNAYDEIVNKHQRLYMAKESLDGHSYYSLYAPIFNRNDEMVAIVSTPYSSGTSIMKEAVPHAVLLIILVLTLLAVFSAVSTGVVNAVFSPLTEVSRKMKGAAVDGLETIDYPHDDEISELIASYNRMVHDLEESTRRMAENERDMAWSEMARQVAHEIKNPLTPMKLAIQRLIRFKEKGDPKWVDRFDDLVKVILEQIDNLTETANDFSSFAKLYTEDPVEFDLDKMLQEQLLIFDNKENITLTYIGMPDATILAPRPQLIRVVVNLITNAIQAIEIEQMEAEERGDEPTQGMINILLRNSSQDGFYDVVVEDNGPGVTEENQSKLFTPKFTTKSSGSGLGLAMSRNIVSKCGGEICYMRSISLGGAAFLIRLPKLEA